MTKMRAGDEIEVDGKVYVVVLNASMILTGTGPCKGCAGYNGVLHNEMCEKLVATAVNNEIGCRLPVHLIYKLKGGSDVQDENADDRQVSLTEERKPTDMG